MKRILASSLVLVLIILLLLSVAPSATHADGETPTPTMINDDVTVDLGNGLSLLSHASHEDVAQPKLSIDLCYPTLAGITGPVADTFNQAVDKIIKDSVGNFKKQTLQATPNAALPPEIAAKGSFITLWYEIVTAKATVVSLKFHLNFYTPGDAHPGSYSVSLTYDLHAGKVVALKDLFLPDADYLKTLSEYSIQVLKKAGKFKIPAGAEPTEANYSRWNIDYKGLRITFDDSQVAPHIFGEQIVVVPYTLLKPLLVTDGVLAEVLKTAQVQ